MNTLKFYPKSIRKSYERSIRNAGIKESPEKYHNKILRNIIIATIIFSTILFFLYIYKIFTDITFQYYTLAFFIFLNLFFYFRINLKAGARIKKMERTFPDVISLMSSNLRAGITIDRAFLMAARPEFAPLDTEILKTGKEIATGQEILYAFKRMAERIDSEKISKVINLIVTGLKAGGNISDLLEETSKNMKEKEIIEKKAQSTIVMYVIFIFFAVGIGAPILFGLSTVLVEIVMKLAGQLPDVSSSSSLSNVPFAFNKVTLSLNFVIYFSLIFMIMSDLISSLVIGLVNKGEGKEGLKYFLPLLSISIIIFYIVRIFLSKMLIGMIGVV